MQKDHPILVAQWINMMILQYSVGVVGDFQLFMSVGFFMYMAKKTH